MIRSVARGLADEILAFVDAKLDTSLKRHTSLLTRLRTSLHTTVAATGLLKDIDALSLEKYVEEAVSAVVEGLGKCKLGPEVVGAVDVRSRSLSFAQSSSQLTLIASADYISPSSTISNSLYARFHDFVVTESSTGSFNCH
jgi:hypothetical protein